jgi:valyl-tRNA synthetase
VKQARAKIVEMLKQAGALEKVEPYRHSVGHCDRCGAVIEPLVSPQWWVRMKGLAQPAIEVAEKDDLRFHPARWREAYLRWLYNIRDWCISRQIWLGHRIPVWTCANGHQVAYRNDPQRCSECGNGDLAQDPDVLDTWFSSALWPFATLGWPAKTEDLRRFYPTQLLDTGRDILYLWVARMVFMGLHFTQVSPFSDVLIHGTVLATDGRRMSKSLGTGVDPLEMIARYGADATRAWCSYFGTTGQDIRFSEEKIKSYQLFANKLWNAVRLVISRLDSKESNSALSAADRWILGRLSLVTRQVTSAFERFDFGPAIDLLYEFLWHELADYHLEWMKAGLASPQVSATVLERALRLLHPIMPFVTEELWQRLPHDGETIMYASWPEPDATVEDGQLATEMGHLLEVVRAVRNVRQQLGDPVSRLKAHLESTRPMMTQAEGRGYLATLARLDLDGTLPDSQASVVVGETRVALAVGAKKGAERERLESELRRAEADIQSLRTKLDNPGFTSRAPADVVARERERLTRLRETADRLRKSLDAT